MDTSCHMDLFDIPVTSFEEYMPVQAGNGQHAPATHAEATSETPSTPILYTDKVVQHHRLFQDKSVILQSLPLALVHRLTAALCPTAQGALAFALKAFAVLVALVFAALVTDL